MPTETVKNRRIGAIPQSRWEESRGQGWDGAIAVLARRQHGVVGRRQLLELGLGKDAIQHRIAGGRLHPLLAGVYVVGHRLVPRHGWLMAAVLASEPNAVLSHHAAAVLWGLRGPTERAVDVTVPRKSTCTKQIRRHHSLLRADERTIKEGIPVTTVPRTIFDLAAIEPADTVENLLREAEFHQHTDHLSLPDLVERYPGKRGTRKVQLALKRLREEPGGRRRSALEERFAPFLRRYRLPLPRFNDWIVLGAKRFCVDCHWPEARLIVELDGWEGHGSRTAFREDRARDRRLVATGYSVTRLTWNQLGDEPEAIAADLRESLSSR